MHPTAMQNGKAFFETYAPSLSSSDKVTVVDIGSQDVNGSLRDVCQGSLNYIGVDFIKGTGVDIVQEDPYKLPFTDSSVEIVVSSSCFEHSDMFWVLFLEIMRVLKPEGLFYLNAPSNGYFHRYPVDCWRFYPDSGHALVRWAKRNGYSPSLLESYISTQIGDIWNDFVAIYVKDEAYASRYRKRILHSKKDVYNGYLPGTPDFVNLSELTEDQKKLSLSQAKVEQLRDRIMQINSLLHRRSVSLEEHERCIIDLTNRLRKQLWDTRRLSRLLDDVDNAAVRLRSSRRWKMANPGTAIQAKLFPGKVSVGYGHLEKIVAAYSQWCASHPEITKIEDEIKALQFPMVPKVPAAEPATTTESAKHVAPVSEAPVPQLTPENKALAIQPPVSAVPVESIHNHSSQMRKL